MNELSIYLSIYVAGLLFYVTTGTGKGEKGAGKLLGCVLVMEDG